MRIKVAIGEIKTKDQERKREKLKVIDLLGK